MRRMPLAGNIWKHPVCMENSWKVFRFHAILFVFVCLFSLRCEARGNFSVSYTDLTLPTICSV